jgi:hypothetical protein
MTRRPATYWYLASAIALVGLVVLGAPGTSAPVGDTVVAAWLCLFVASLLAVSVARWLLIGWGLAVISMTLGSISAEGWGAVAVLALLMVQIASLCVLEVRR